MQNIEEWWRYIHNYIRTLAQWSYLCYVTQLGDRHLTNILISHTGKFIHIDY
jgi:phosphatidylinositol kinase/protein kinase (PI-3  family)